MLKYKVYLRKTHVAESRYLLQCHCKENKSWRKIGRVEMSESVWSMDSVQTAYLVRISVSGGNVNDIAVTYWAPHIASPSEGHRHCSVGISVTSKVSVQSR